MGLFNIFRRRARRLSSPVDLSILGCDIHSHLVPAVDDGSKSVEDSIEMIQGLNSLGYKKFITTPHVMSDFYRNTPETILGGLEKVKEGLQQTELKVEMEAAAEYYLDGDFEHKLDEGKLLTFGKNYILFEISYMNPPDNLYHIIFKMQTMGYKTVLAHPERYNFWHNDFSKYEAFIDKGVYLQLNINSLTGYYSLPTKMIAQRMIDNDMISFLGTDCHHVGHVNLMKEVVFEPHLEKLVQSGKLLNNTL
jgi:tyrosine-protein phosphatase YwqE